MTKSIDPFEEYLRKKKVELLEKKYRDQPEQGGAPAPAARPGAIPPDEDPEIDARLRKEMDDFLRSGQDAGLKAFEQASTIGDDKVDEIKDALDDVFEEDAPVPQTVDENDDAGDTFVSFFKQVQEQYDEKPVCDNVACLPSDEGPASASKVPDFSPADLRGASVEIAFDEDQAEIGQGTRDERLDLAELLVEGAKKQDLNRRVEVLCRVVAKLVERSGLPESEVVEALIKSGFEF